MYLPQHFAEPHAEELHRIVQENPLGMLVTNTAAGLEANHLPFLLDAEQGVLLAHVARANPVWREVASGDTVLVVFRGVHGYISPNWYPSKHEAHKQVPTWNYRVVHAHGRITILDDERYVRGVIGRLTRTHEASQPTPWKMADAPRDYTDAIVKAIVGVQIEITRLVGKSKLSQNKEERDIRGAGEALKSLGASPIGDAMLAAAAQKAQ